MSSGVGEAPGAVALRAEPVALAYEDREYTRPQLDQLAAGLAVELAGRGVRAGDRVALMSSNRPEFVVAVLALWRLNAAVVLISPAWKRAELEHALALTEPVLAVGDSPLLAPLLPMRDLDEPIAPLNRTSERPDQDADAVLVFSSGTTGLPKAVRHTHASIDAAVRDWIRVLGLNSYDRLQILTPPAHILGLLNIVTALRTGAWMRLHRRFDIDAMLRCIAQDRITIEMAVAPIALALAAHPGLESRDLSSLRYIMWGATRCAEFSRSSMDVRLTSEQRQLRDAAAKLADDLGPGSVLGLDDEARVARLERAVAQSGWRALRSDGASGVEVAIVAEEFGRGLVDVPFLGPVLADDLRGQEGTQAWTIAVRGAGGSGRPTAGDPDETLPGVRAIDARGADRALYVGDGKLFAATVDPRRPEVDLTRIDAGLIGEPEVLCELSADRAARWRALAWAATAADLVGVARGAQALAVDYAKIRAQYGKTIGSYQAVAHLLAENQALIEGSISVLRHAAWVADELPVGEAVRAGRIAKVYCARAAHTVCETAIQVHGGIGNTWECLAHVYLRRALTSTELFPVSLEEIDCGLS